MRFSNKVLALSLATVTGPLLALAAHHVGNGMNYGSPGGDSGDGAFIRPVTPTPYGYEWIDGEWVLVVTGPGPGGGSGGGAGSGSGGGTGCPSGMSPHVQLGCETGGGGGGDNTQPPPSAVATHSERCGTDDGAAAQIADRVKGALPPGTSGPPDPLRTSEGKDWTQVEFGAGIVRHSDGRFGASDAVIYSNNNPRSVTVPFVVGSQIQGFWHNHTIRDGSWGQEYGRYPSDGDWITLQTMSTIPGVSTDPSIWLTGIDGVTREFKLSERNYIESLTDAQKTNGVGIVGRERTNTCSEQ